MLLDPAFAHLISTRITAQNAIPAIATPTIGLDASQTSTMFLDTAATTLAGAGQTIGRVNDAFGGTGFSWQQATSGVRPTLVTNLAAGKPGVRFGGTQWLRLLPTSNSGVQFQSRSFTVACVYRGRRSDNDYSIVWSAGNADGGEANEGYDQLALELGPNGLPNLMRHTGSEFGGCFSNATDIPSSNLVKLVGRGSQANGIELRLRSAAGSFSGTASIASSADVHPWDAATIGAGNRWHEFLYPTISSQSDVHELRFWGSRASDTLFDSLQAYLDTKWGA
jgi:hypothetical protein